MTSQGLLTGRKVLVTGGATGLGRAIVERFADEGAAGMSFDSAGNQDGLPNGWQAMTGDVTREDDVASAVEQTRSTLGSVDVIVANAGVVPPWSETEHMDLDEWDKVFAVNVRGVAATIKHAVPAMKDTGGSIIVMGSLNSWQAHPRLCLYSATKHAVLGIVRAAALDLGRYGIRVNAIGPGPIATDALRSRVERRAAEGGVPADEAFATMASGTALGRIATETDVANTAVFLASDLSNAQSGLLVPVDCGIA